jgi:hypothetical protein
MPTAAIASSGMDITTGMRLQVESLTYKRKYIVREKEGGKRPTKLLPP